MIEAPYWMRLKIPLLRGEEELKIKKKFCISSFPSPNNPNNPIGILYIILLQKQNDQTQERASSFHDKESVTQTDWSVVYFS